MNGRRQCQGVIPDFKPPLLSPQLGASTLTPDPGPTGGVRVRGEQLVADRSEQVPIST